MARSRRIHEFFKVLLSPLMLRIRSGPLKGRRWIASSGSNFISGRYEPEKTATIADNVVAGEVVFDVGAHVGYFAVLMSQLAGETGKVFAFEPRPLNLRFLKRHVAVNDCTNIEILPLCVGERTGPAMLETRTGTGTGHVSETGDTAVRMVSLDELVEAGTLPPPTFVKIDVEGGEMGVLLGARRTIDRYRPRMVLATHDEQLDRQCHELLGGMGYQLTDIGQVKGDVEYLVLPRPE
jgi:FkbM family methyltransferase